MIARYKIGLVMLACVALGALGSKHSTMKQGRWHT